MMNNITPNTRFYIAYFSGVIAAATPIMLRTDSGHWSIWATLFLANIAVYVWNYNAFRKETLWMTIKNPAKITREDGDDIWPPAPPMPMPRVRPPAPPAAKAP